MNILEFFDQHTFLAFVAIALSLHLLCKCSIELITLFKLPFRSHMVTRAGWPPEYLDADGDTHHKRDDSNDEQSK